MVHGVLTTGWGDLRITTAWPGLDSRLITHKIIHLISLLWLYMCLDEVLAGRDVVIRLIRPLLLLLLLLFELRRKDVVVLKWVASQITTKRCRREILSSLNLRFKNLFLSKVTAHYRRRFPHVILWFNLDLSVWNYVNKAGLCTNLRTIISDFLMSWADSARTISHTAHSVSETTLWSVHSGGLTMRRCQVLLAHVPIMERINDVNAWTLSSWSIYHAAVRCDEIRRLKTLLLKHLLVLFCRWLWLRHWSLLLFCHVIQLFVHLLLNQVDLILLEWLLRCWWGIWI